MLVIKNYSYYPKPIGKGSFSKVYRGINRDTQEVVAIKRILVSEQNNMIKMFQREIQIIRKIDHENIVKCHDVIIEELDKKTKKIFVIMEYCEGSDLDHYMKKYPKRSESEVKELIRQLISGLKYLFRHGINHRDIKPQNLLLSKKDVRFGMSDQVLKIIDFGFAKEWTHESEMFQTLCGTPLYLAPEIITSHKYDIKADAWSLGIILYQLVFDIYPYLTSQGFMPNNLFVLLSVIKKTGTPDIDRKHISESCKDLIISLLKLNPEDRITWDDIFEHEWFREVSKVKKKKVTFKITDDNREDHLVCKVLPIDDYVDTFLKKDAVIEDSFVHITKPIPFKRETNDEGKSNISGYIQTIKSAIFYVSGSPIMKYVQSKSV